MSAQPHGRSAIEKAHRALRSARTLLLEDPAGAANRTYYAAFYAARTALLSADEAPRTHAGMRGRFALHFVRTGHLAPEIGRALGVAEHLRLLADYDDGATIEPDDVEPVLALVVRFVEAIEALLSSADDALGADTEG